MTDWVLQKHTNQDLAAWPTNFPIVTSTFDNCVLYNAILKNSNPYDDDEVRYLRQLQGADQQSVGEYYRRSEHIIEAMREQGADNDSVWDQIDRSYVDDIIKKLKVRNFSTLFSDILHMIEQLELQYGVINNGG
tara:strand:- start:13 stop:414 length:402 start_codon:yes stop_codon:yes gene_type:complete